MTGDCHCGRVTVSVSHVPPFMNACNCTLCLKRGVLWGYYAAGDVTVAGETREYLRADVAQPRLRNHFCGHCGTATHWALVAADGEDRMGVNMRLFDPAALKGVEVRYGDRRNHDKAAARTWREPTVFDGAGVEA